MMKKIISFSMIMLFLFSCSTVKISGRKQLALIPNSQLFPASFAQYDQFIKENKISANVTQTQRIKTISDNLVGAVNKYYAHKGWTSDLKGYEWEVHLVDDAQLNAFCMPGGKIVYYTGLLSVTTSDAEIAAVMGHEIAHALANHGSERMTIAYGQNLGAVLTALATRNASKEDQAKWMAIYGVGSTLGAVLPYSRTHESESDKIGQIIMAVGGYNPDAAAVVWKKMGEMSGQQMPAFLSTHPSHDTRMENLKKWSPEAKQIAAQFGVRF
jgi:predicted Zn-dependent protease